MARLFGGHARWLAVTSLVAVVASWATVAPAASQDKVIVRWFVGLGTGEDAAQIAHAQDAVDAFNAQASDVQLVVEVAPRDQVHDDLATRIAMGEAPDLVGPTDQRTFTGFPGQWLDLGPLVDATSGGTDLYGPGLLGAYESGGSLVGLPFAAFPAILFYNADLFDQAGLAYPPHALDEPYVMPDGSVVDWDYDTVAEVAKLLTVDANGNDATSPDFKPGKTVQWGFTQQYTRHIGHDAAALFGPNPPLVGDGIVTIPGSWRDTASWYQTLMYTDHVMPTVRQLETRRLGGQPGQHVAGNAFASGNVAMLQAHLWYLQTLPFVQDVRLGTWDLGVMPRGADGVTTAPLQADAFTILATSRDPDAAFQVLSYLLESRDLQAAYGYLPSARSDLRDGYYRSLDQRYPGVDWQVDVAMLPYPDVPSYLADFPGYVPGQRRIQEFTLLVLGTPPGDLDLDAELDLLQRDLQAIVDEPS